MKSNWQLSNKSRNVKFFIIVLLIGAVIVFAGPYVYRFWVNYNYNKGQNQFVEIEKIYNEKVTEYNIEVAEINEILNKFSDYSEAVLDEPYNEKNASTIVYSGSASITEMQDAVSAIDEEIVEIRGRKTEICQLAFAVIANDYNVLAKSYNDLSGETAVQFIEEIPNFVDEIITDDLLEGITTSNVFLKIDDIEADIQKLSEYYCVAMQITRPDTGWVIERLRNIPAITEISAVSSDNDPNGLLGLDGGYTGCIYFSLESIDQNEIPGDNIIEKGTDCGGAIEIYDSLDFAMARCDYLSQFDGTILYSGSYVLVGTMVIRASYILSNTEQIEITGNIVSELTALTKADELD